MRCSYHLSWNATIQLIQRIGGGARNAEHKVGRKHEFFLPDEDGARANRMAAFPVSCRAQSRQVSRPTGCLFRGVGDALDERCRTFHVRSCRPALKGSVHEVRVLAGDVCLHCCGGDVSEWQNSDTVNGKIGDMPVHGCPKSSTGSVFNSRFIANCPIRFEKYRDTPPLVCQRNTSLSNATDLRWSIPILPPTK